MILRRLRIRRFKKFQDTTFAFVPGLNIIQGPNESGKTTVMEALFAALLVNPLQPQERKGVVDNLRDIQQQILDWMGLPSEAAVRSTAYVGQGELARLTDDRHPIGARLSQILRGGGAANGDGAP